MLTGLSRIPGVTIVILVGASIRSGTQIYDESASRRARWHSERVLKVGRRGASGLKGGLFVVERRERVCVDACGFVAGEYR